MGFDILKWLMALTTSLGTKLPQAWPHLVIAFNELKIVLEIATGVSFSMPRSADSAEGQQFVDLAHKAGVPQAEAAGMASVARGLSNLTKAA